MAGTGLKVAQLAALPALLVLVAVVKTPRAPHLSSSFLADDTKTTLVAPAQFFASGAQPAIPLPRGAAAPVGTRANGWFQTTVVADFADEETASRLASEVGGLLDLSLRHFDERPEARARLLDELTAAPLTPAEAAAFERRGVRAEIGVGAVSSQVLRFGRVVVVPCLKGDFGALRPNPLAAFFAAAGARVLVEGDPGGGASPLVDIACEAPDEATARSLASSFEHYLASPGALCLRPPWHPSGVSVAEERARATFHSVVKAVRRALADPQMFEELQDRTRWTRDPTELARIMEEVRRERLQRAIDACASRGEADSVVIEELRRMPLAALSLTFDPQAIRRLAERLGSLQVEVERAYAATGRVQVRGKRVELGRVVFHRFAEGLPRLLATLEAAGCTEIRLGLSSGQP
jgi:hypothetical protein